MDIYTRKGDDGSTGLFYGGRVPKGADRPEAYGTVDEAQACIGLARAATAAGGELDQMLVGLARDLYVLMAELATSPENQQKLVDGTTRVTPDMVTALERQIDTVGTRFAMPTEFVIPGQAEVAARLDVARTVVRRAERATSRLVLAPGSQALPYLNRLSDLLWALARWQEGDSLITKGEA